MQSEIIEAPVTDAPASSALRALLDANLRLPPEYHGGMANHLPMALHALDALGADAQRLQAFYASYVPRFEGRSASPPAQPASDWRLLRGQPDEEAYAVLAATFTAAIEREGKDAVLRLVLPDLLPGVAAAAFHGVIRTAHAVQSGHSGELARALAYWAWRWQDLAPAAPDVPKLSFGRWSERLVGESADQRFIAPLISRRIELATASPVYQDLGNALVLEPDVLQRLAGFALATYLKSRNFTVLHMITGLRAIRVMLPWVADAQAIQPMLVRAFTAAWLAAQVKPLESPSGLQDADWPTVTAAAIASDNDHVIKLVHACREEFQAYGDPRYLAAAALATS